MISKTVVAPETTWLLVIRYDVVPVLLITKPLPSAVPPALLTTMVPTLGLSFAEPAAAAPWATAGRTWLSTEGLGEAGEPVLRVAITAPSAPPPAATAASTTTAPATTPRRRPRRGDGCGCGCQAGAGGGGGPAGASKPSGSGSGGVCMVMGSGRSSRTAGGGWRGPGTGGGGPAPPTPLRAGSFRLLDGCSGGGPVGRADERLLDPPRRHPAQQVDRRPGLVVGATGAAAAEGLLADHGAGRLVVDVEVARRVAQHVCCGVDGGAVGGEDGAGEPVRRGGVDGVQQRLPVGLIVRMHREDGAEELALHQLVVGVVGLEDGGTHEPADGAVALAAGDEADGVVAPRCGHDCLVAAESALVDDRPHEVAQVRRVAHAQRLRGLGERAAHPPGPR